jgi:hypothetical protein
MELQEEKNNQEKKQNIQPNNTRHGCGLSTNNSSSEEC